MWDPEVRPEDIPELFKYQAESTIRYILNDNKNMSLQEATKLWFNSKTLEYFREHNMCWVAPSRCYWELQLELNHDRRWLSTSFD